MEERTLGRTGLRVGTLGMGVEHLNVSEDKMKAVFDLAVLEGVNYVDLCYNDPIEDHADHWQAIEPSLRRHRDSLNLALHWGFVYHEPQDHCQRCFEAALERVGNGYVELAFIGLIDSKQLWQGWAQEAINKLRQYQKNGCVGFIGLANHNVEVARMAVASGLVDVLMFPVNMYQHPGDPERRALLEMCAQRKIGVVAMKPYYGGRLITADGRPTGITPVQCLHYVLSQPVATTVPGVQNVEHLRQAVGYVRASEADRQYGKLGEELTSRLRGQCVLCKHCLPCPQEINIPLVINCLNYVEYFSGTAVSEGYWRQLSSRSPAPASSCTECALCVDRCPFGVDIVGKMKRAVEVLETVA